METKLRSIDRDSASFLLLQSPIFRIFATDRCLHQRLPEQNLNILTSTKNASLLITDFFAMIYKNEQPRTASLCRGWAMLENGLNLICR